MAAQEGCLGGGWVARNLHGNEKLSLTPPQERELIPCQ